MNWRSNKKFFVAFLQANVNFQKNGLTVKNKKKSKKIQPEYTKIEKKNQKKSSKEISVKDHSDYKRYQKNVRY